MRAQWGVGALIVAAAFLVATTANAQAKLEIYGHADMSWDAIDQGGASIPKNFQCHGGPCVGVTPYTQVASNTSYLGFRMTQELDSGVSVLFQVESTIEISATPSERAGFGSRDSYLGLGTSNGNFKIGKSDSPYKKATGRLDPFSFTVGDYNAIMGNTGGDGRAEFDLRLPHAIWWESPKFGAHSFVAMAAPGQNRSRDTLDFPNGDFVCSGSISHQSGADPNQDPTANGCDDGSFGDAYSFAYMMESGPLYLTAAYEQHQKVDRHTDDAGSYLGATVGVHDESAWKLGAQYKVSPATAVNAIFESLQRDRGNEPSKVDERSRTGYYVSGTQKAGGGEFSLAWAHADKTAGDPGEAKAVSLDNEANLYSVGYRRYLAKQVSVYAVYAQMSNNTGAHYILGSSGHGTSITGRDAGSAFTCDPNTGCVITDPTTGLAKSTQIQSFSVGMSYYFNAPFEVKVSQ